MTEAYDKESEAKGKKVSAAVAKGRAKATAKVAGGVFVEKDEYDGLVSKVKQLKAENSRLKEALRSHESGGGTDEGNKRAAPRRFASPFKKGLSPQFLRAGNSARKASAKILASKDVSSPDSIPSTPAAKQAGSMRVDQRPEAIPIW